MMMQEEWSARCRKFIGMVARLSPVTIDATDDVLEDTVATLNRLISEARKLGREGGRLGNSGGDEARKRTASDDMTGWIYAVPRLGPKRKRKLKPKKKRKFPPSKSIRAVSGGLPSLGKHAR